MLISNTLKFKHLKRQIHRAEGRYGEPRQVEGPCERTLPQPVPVRCCKYFGRLEERKYSQPGQGYARPDLQHWPSP